MAASGTLSRTLMSVLSPKSLRCTIVPNASVEEAVERMVHNNVGSLVVMDPEQGSKRRNSGSEHSTSVVVGIVTERDYLKKFRPSTSQLVKDIMTADVQCVTGDTTLADCMELMIEGDFRHVPVLLPTAGENHATEFVGVISMRDVIRELVKEKKSTIEHYRDQINKLANAVGGQR